MKKSFILLLFSIQGTIVFLVKISKSNQDNRPSSKAESTGLFELFGLFAVRGYRQFSLFGLFWEMNFLLILKSYEHVPKRKVSKRNDNVNISKSLDLYVVHLHNHKIT